MCFVPVCKTHFYGNPSFLKVRKAKFGKGFFATKNIAAYTFSILLITFERFTKPGTKKSYCLQIERDAYILCASLFFIYQSFVFTELRT